MALPSQEERYWTYADLPDDGVRYEIIDGHRFVTPSPSLPHQTVSRRLQFLLYEFERQGKGFIIDAPADLFMPGADPVVPDLMWLTADQKSLMRRNGVHGAPMLLVEILSPSTAAYDRTVKLRKFAQCGVPHYWLLHPDEKTLQAFELAPHGHYVLQASLRDGEIFESVLFEGLKIDLTDLFADLPDSPAAAED